MEIKAELLKPCTENERINFIVEQNHRNGYTIEEVETALVAWGDTDEEKLQQAKQAKYTEANTGARAYLESGEALFELEADKHIEATDGNIGKLSAYALSFITGTLQSEDVIYWNTKEDETIALTQEQLSTVLQGIGRVQAEVWNIKFPAYLARLEAAQTVEDVDAIVIDYSQPLPETEEEQIEENSDIEV